MEMIVRLLLSLVILGISPLATPAETRDPEDHFFNLNTGDLKAESADAKNAGKRAIFVMFEQDGCPGCLYMKKNVLNRVAVQKFYRERFVNFTINIYGAVPITDFAGRDFTEKSYAQSLGIEGTPTLAFYDLGGKEVVRMLGPIKDATEFLLLGKFVVSGAYKTRQFAEYRQSQRRKKGN